MKFKATTYKIKSGNCKGWFDCAIWCDDIMIRATSGTAFETKEKAKEYSVYLLKQYRG